MNIDFKPGTRGVSTLQDLEQGDIFVFNKNKDSNIYLVCDDDTYISLRMAECFPISDYLDTIVYKLVQIEPIKVELA